MRWQEVKPLGVMRHEVHAVMIIVEAGMKPAHTDASQDKMHPAEKTMEHVRLMDGWA